MFDRVGSAFQFIDTFTDDLTNEVLKGNFSIEQMLAMTQVAKEAIASVLTAEELADFEQRCQDEAKRYFEEAFS